MRALAVVLALALAALGWQSWRLNNASHAIETLGAEKQNAGADEEKQPTDRPVHSERNQQPGADEALCGSGANHRTVAQPSAPDRGVKT